MTDEEVKHYDDKWKRLDAEIATLRAEVDRLTEINADAVIRLDDRLLRAEKAEAALAAADDLVAEVVVDRALARNSSDESNDHSPAMRIVREYRALRDAK